MGASRASLIAVFLVSLVAATQGRQAEVSASATLAVA
jgi:hypothetical protein